MSQSFPSAILSAAASNPAWSKNGLYMNFPYTVEQVILAMRKAYIYKFNAGSNAKLNALRTELDKFVNSRYYDHEGCHCKEIPVGVAWTESVANSAPGTRPSVDANKPNCLLSGTQGSLNPADGNCDACACTGMGESKNYCECLTGEGPSVPVYPFR
ncbi:hypothetical protein T492DRAFT_1023519 [Pavlovales sp. CCMP2436]|nr:hypothetical protein T492DRAFT_1023519 [Pavlovales sp. CCMP2436]